MPTCVQSGAPPHVHPHPPPLPSPPADADGGGGGRAVAGGAHAGGPCAGHAAAHPCTLARRRGSELHACTLPNMHPPTQPPARSSPPPPPPLNCQAPSATTREAATGALSNLACTRAFQPAILEVSKAPVRSPSLGGSCTCVCALPPHPHPPTRYPPLPPPPPGWRRPPPARSHGCWQPPRVPGGRRSRPGQPGVRRAAWGAAGRGAAGEGWGEGVVVVVVI